MNTPSKSQPIVIEQLRVGMFVILDIHWLDHDFPRSSFKVKNEEQLAKIRQLGLKKVRIDPSRSDVAPETVPPSALTPAADAVAASAEESEVAKAKRERVERINKLRSSVVECERQFLKTATTLKAINGNLFAAPDVAYQRANELVDQMVDSVLTDRDIAIHLMKDKYGGEDMYFHSLNVSVLAMMVAKQLNLPRELVKELGFGSLFHDVGKLDIPDKVLMKAVGLTRAEQNLMEQHCVYGEPIAKKLGLSKQATDIILQHHEHMDGSGYPKQLKGDHISSLARIVAVVNTYDNLCNRINPADSLSPFAALSHMYAQKRNQLDGGPLGVFIRCLGVYPPGTVVKLSDGTFGLVVSVNAGKPLRPSVLIYDAEVPSSEAIILELEDEPELNIAECLRPAQLPRAALEYLAPRRRMTYYFDLPQRPAKKG
ncbi:HD-GYP domain-containing protein [Herbaspirillum sp. HC18]|nr:HD-GYP domain-containing protein [Herbaspirillum sp. HC18]